MRQSHGEVFSPVDVCAAFGISRTTLFRWEAMRLLDEVPRDDEGQRRYGQEHLRQITAILRKKLRKECELKAARDLPVPSVNHQEQLAIFDLFNPEAFQFSLSRLRREAQIRGLSKTTVELLTRKGLSLSQGNPDRVRIFEVVLASERRQQEQIVSEREYADS